MFLNTYNHSVDSKNRVIIPVNFREELGQNFAVMRGVEKCLYLYPNEEFKKFMEKFTAISSVDRKGQAFVRIFAASASMQNFDSQGRIIVPPALKEYAGLSKDVVVIGAIDRVEIWDAEAWKSYNESVSENYDDVLNSVTAAGI